MTHDLSPRTRRDLVLLALYLAAFALCVAARAAHALDRHVYPGASPSYRDAVMQSAPGDRVLMHAGVYRGGEWLGPVRGTAAAPIQILSVDGPRRAVIEGGGECLRIGDASSYLVVDGLEVRNCDDNAIHLDGGSSYVTFRNVYAHHSANGDDLKVNQCHHIAVEQSEFGFSGARSDASNPSQEAIDFLDVDDSRIADCHLHHSLNMLMVFKGGSRRGVVERTVFDCTTARSGVDPCVGMGGASDLNLLQGEQYEAIGLAFRNNVIWGGASGALGVYDVQGLYAANNLIVNAGAGVVVFRAGTGPAGATENAQFVNNVVVDTRGTMPPVLLLHSHALRGLAWTWGLLYNRGVAIPTAGALNVTTQTGHLAADPLVALPATTTALDRAALVAAFHPRLGSPATNSGADASGAPFGVVDDLMRVPRGTRRDRGPYVLSAEAPVPTPVPTPVPPVTDGGVVAPAYPTTTIPVGANCLCVCR